MPQWVTNILFSSRTWLTASAICVSAAMVIGYHQDQMSAQIVLTQKVGRPDEVLIQDFSADSDMNIINEVRVLGEFDPRLRTVLNIGTEEHPSWIAACPIFPVGFETMPYVAQRLGSGDPLHRRPVPREDAPMLAAHRSDMARISDRVMAFSIHKIASPDAAHDIDDDNFDVLAEGETRTLVSVAGSVVGGTDLRNGLVDALAGQGLSIDSDSILIDPADEQAGAAGLDGITSLRHWFVLAAALTAVCAMLMPHIASRRTPQPRKPVAENDVRATSRLPGISFFQPIATQDELSLIEQQALAERSKSGNIRSGITRIVMSLVQAGMRIRSPR